MSSGVRTSQMPNFSFQRSSTPMPYSFGKPALNCCGGSLSTLGNMKRPVAASAAADAAENAPHARPIHARRVEQRRGVVGIAGRRLSPQPPRAVLARGAAGRRGVRRLAGQVGNRRGRRPRRGAARARGAGGRRRSAPSAAAAARRSRGVAAGPAPALRVRASRAAGSARPSCGRRPVGHGRIRASSPSAMPP